MLPHKLTSNKTYRQLSVYALLLFASLHIRGLTSVNYLEEDEQHPIRGPGTSRRACPHALRTQLHSAAPPF